MKPLLPTRQGRKDTIRIIPFFSQFTGQITHPPSLPPNHLTTPLPLLLLQVLGPVMSGSLPNHIRAWSKLQEQEGEQENLISHSVGIKPQATSQDHRRRATSHRPYKRLRLNGGRWTGSPTCCNLEDRIQRAKPCSMCLPEIDDRMDKI